jgi:hypothetical protein
MLTVVLLAVLAVGTAIYLLTARSKQRIPIEADE